MQEENEAIEAGRVDPKPTVSPVVSTVHDSSSTIPPVADAADFGTSAPAADPEPAAAPSDKE